MYSLLLFFLTLGAFQTEVPMKDQDAFESKFMQVSQDTKSIICDFKQEKFISFSKKPLVSEGKMWYQDQKMRWQQNSPDEYIMVINDETLTTKEKGKIKEHPLNENKMMKGMKEIMIGSMTGSFFQSDQFKTTLLNNGEHNIIKLVPKLKRVKKLFSEIKMYFDPETYRMDKLIFSEPNGDYTQLVFSGASYNQNIKPNKFSVE